MTISIKHTKCNQFTNAHMHITIGLLHCMNNKCLHQVLKLTDGSKRRKLTDIVNNYLVHDSKGKLVTNEQHPMFIEMEKKSRERYHDSSNTGCLLLEYVIITPCALHIALSVNVAQANVFIATEFIYIRCKQVA